MYAENSRRLEAQLAAVRVEIGSHEEADNNFKETLLTEFKLANK